MPESSLSDNVLKIKHKYAAEGGKGAAGVAANHQIAAAFAV